MFRIKICGLTSLEDALAAAEAGADAIGLNFYPGSPRYVMLDDAAAIAANLPANVLKVGVFVNAAATDIRRHVAAVGLDAVQLHGDEPPEFLSELKGISLLRALRPAPGETASIHAWVARARELNVLPDMLLVDALRAGEYGGTGARADWTAAAQLCREESLPPICLAGGLNPENVADAIAAVRPTAVDVASGVESSPGRKDAQKMRHFVAAARQAFGFP